MYYTFAVDIYEALEIGLLVSGEYQIIDSFYDYYGRQILILRKKRKCFHWGWFSIAKKLLYKCNKLNQK